MPARLEPCPIHAGTQGSDTHQPRYRPNMNCRDFRRRHDAYVDDTLSGVDIDAMTHHLRLCDGCARLDTRVRRALLVVRNLPGIEPSRAFAARLEARLEVERVSMRHLAVLQHDGRATWRPAMTTTSYTALAAGVLAAAAIAAATLAPARHDVTRLDSAVAVRSATPAPLSMAGPTIVAAMPAGMPLWPAVFVAQEAPWHFASDVAGH